MMRRVDAGMAVLGGTFRQNTDRSSGRYYASLDFIPEVAEAEEAERSFDPLRRGFVSIEDVADPSAGDAFLRVTGEIED